MYSHALLKSDAGLSTIIAILHGNTAWSKLSMSAIYMFIMPSFIVNTRMATPEQTVHFKPTTVVILRQNMWYI